MEDRILFRVKRIGDAANRAVLAHLRRAEGYKGLTLSEREALAAMWDEIAALQREAAHPLSGTAA